MLMQMLCGLILNLSKNVIPVLTSYVVVICDVDVSQL